MSNSLPPDVQATLRAQVERDSPCPPDCHHCIEAVTAVVREADRLFESVGGSSRHWVRDCFLPLLEKNGMVVHFADQGFIQHIKLLKEREAKAKAELAAEWARQQGLIAEWRRNAEIQENAGAMLTFQRCADELESGQ